MPGGGSEKAEATSDPHCVRNALATLAESWPAGVPELAQVLAGFPLGDRALPALLAASPISAEKLKRDPEALLWLAQPGVSASDRGPRRMKLDLDLLRPHGDNGVKQLFDPAFAVLRRSKAREMLRIALREVAGVASLEQTTLELTYLAELCLREVVEGWLAELSRRWGDPGTDFAVLGMGKLGGRELNYSSDIDVMFLYGEEGMLNPRFSRHEFFARLGEKIVTSFTVMHPAGTLFRIDLRLRPEGGSGPLVRSLESMENYYAGFGETWERMALIKARGVCCSEELAYEFGQRLQSFIFPRTMSADLLDEVRSIKHRIERDVVGSEHLSRNVKLGYGGIREIEFVVQTLQVLHGARHPFLQNNNTLKTLEGLLNLGFLPPGDVSMLTDAYRFLRKVEHRLQIEQEAQTHTLPDKPQALARLAANLGFPGPEEFEGELHRHTGNVRGVFDRILRSDRAPDEIRESDLNWFHDPHQVKKNLDHLREGMSAHVSPRTRQLFGSLEPRLLAALREVADPDVALSRFARFVDRYGIRGLLFETLLVNPKLLDLLVRLFDSSEFLSNVVLRRPQLIEEVVRGGLVDQRLDVNDHLSGLAANEEQLSWMDGMRVYRRSQILRIFLRDVLGLAGIEDLHFEYSALAEACVLFTQQQLGLNEAFTVVAMGKFGGSELSYGCDLDLVFADGSPVQPAALIRAMTSMTPEGLVFPIDVRLRPEGDAGLLTLPVSGYKRYFETRAQLWEAQALTKARPISGPAQAEFLQMAQEAWRRFGQRAELLAEIRAMHERVVTERSPGGDYINFKTGRGGLMGLEFMVQGLQMKHDVWEPNTVRALQKLEATGVLSADDAESARADYLFLRRTEAVIRRMENAGVSTLPRDKTGQEKLAQRLGFESLEKFSTAYQATRDRIQALFTRELSR